MPPFGIGKRLRGEAGWTEVAGIPLLPFRLDGLTLRYRVLPIRDELTARPDGTLAGVGYFLGWPFCRFRMERAPVSASAPRAAAR